MSPDPIINSLLGKPWELQLENEKVSTTIKASFSNKCADKLPENTGPTNPGSEEWTSNQSIGQPYKQ